MINIKEILQTIDYEIFTGNNDIVISKIVALNDLANDDEINLSWSNDNNLYKLKDLKTKSVIIVSNNATNEITNRLSCIVVKNPRRAFQEILSTFFIKNKEAKIESNSIIDNSTSIGDDVYIGHNVVIESNCVIGNNVKILHNTVILADTKIGNNVTIGCNNTIGGVGFGYEKNENGDFQLIPHIGNVIIKNNVEIGNNTCIDRAVLGSTIIGENVKIDNLVHIAHGVTIGSNSVIIANAMIAGSVKIEENVWIAPSASVLNQKSIGSNSLVGLGAVVTKDVKMNAIVVGNPAKFIKTQ